MNNGTTQTTDAARASRYQVKDTRTGNVVGTYCTLQAASKRADRLDLAYGAVRYTVSRTHDDKLAGVVRAGGHGGVLCVFAQ